MSNSAHGTALEEGALMLTVRQMCDAREEERKTYCRKPGPQGRATRTVFNVRDAHRELCDTPDPSPSTSAGTLWREDGRLLRDVPAKDFTPAMLHAVKQHMLKGDRLGRRQINERLREIKATFKWACSPEIGLLPVHVWRDLDVVTPLKQGRSPAREGRTILPVSLEAVQATALFADDQLQTMIWVQWFTGMRPQEVVQMSRSTIDTRSEPWIYTPQEHKTQHFGKERVIYLGEKCRQLLTPWLARPSIGEWLFPGRDVNSHVREQSFYNAIQRLNKANGLTPWHPMQARHAAATRIARGASAEDAQLVLDHSSVNTTKKHYIEKNEARKRELAERFG